jgi:hypothetical protein
MRRRLRFPRLPPTRRLGAAAVTLVVIAVVSAFAQVSAGVHARPRASVAITARPRAESRAPRGASPVSVAGLARARAVARSFVESYLSVVYGRAPASSLTGATPALQAELRRRWAWVTPAERERHARVVSVEAVGQEPGFVLATVWVSDDEIATYALRITVQEGSRGWLVSDVVDG